MMKNRTDYTDRKKSKAVFLDRDGTLNADSAEYIKSRDEFHLFDFTGEALAILTRLGYKNIVITNQSAVGRKMLTVEELDKIHAKLKQELQKSGAVLDDIYYCPHLPEDECDCRKPKTANLVQAIAEHNVDIAESFFIGDSYKDIQTGAEVGLRTVLVQTGIEPSAREQVAAWRPQPDFVAGDLLAAARIIEGLERDRNE